MTSSQRYLGYGGLIPFVFLSLVTLAGIDHAAFFLITYAALIFSFLGGILWGVSLDKRLPQHVSLVAVSSMLWAWVWLLMPGYDWFILAALSFMALWLYEWLLLRRVLDKSFIQLRGQLSLVAAFCLLLGGL
ncbi:DUF3429 domain-containing protein [Methylophaga sp.]|uniref:DUF3429 domain-containing protein n=1 Tax=Methylophaga sp. TaxID=2024840 RepID=UPI003F6A504E